MWIGDGTRHSEIPKCNKDQRTELQEFRIKTLNESVEGAPAFYCVGDRPTALIRRSGKCGKFNFETEVISLTNVEVMSLHGMTAPKIDNTLSEVEQRIPLRLRKAAEPKKNLLRCYV